MPNLYELPSMFEGWRIAQPFSGPDYEVTAPNGRAHVLYAVYMDDGSYDHEASVNRCARLIALRIARQSGMLGVPVVVDDITGTLRRFILDNGDGADAAEIVDMVRALASGETYQGGGGAAAVYTVRRMPPQTLGDAFAKALRESLNDGDWQEMRRRNAALPSDSGACASHDFCDANMVMDSAFRSTVGRACTLPCDVDDGKATEAQADSDMALWNAAWNHAKAAHLTARE